MGFEAGAYNEKEKKLKKDQEEKEQQEFQKKQIEHQKMKEYIQAETETEENLHKLHDLVDQGLITQEQAEDIAQGNELTQEDIQEIFENIDKIEDIKDVDNYLPQDLRVTKDEYFQATTDDVFRVQTLTKLNTALTILSNKINPDSSAGLNLFSGMIGVLDKNLITIQEHNIDMKNNLEEIENTKNPKEKKSFGQEIIDTLKDIFK